MAPASDPKTVVFTITGRIDPDDVPGLCDYVCTRLQARDPDRVICDVGGVVASDAVAVDALAHLQLAARRRGCRIELRAASTELQELLHLAGLSEVLGLTG